MSEEAGAPLIYLVNEISRGLAHAHAHADGDGANLIYAPVIHSDQQRRFFEKRFDGLKTKYPKAQWIPNYGGPLQGDDLVFAWDSDHEQKQYGQNLVVGEQNRLFKELSFNIPDSFSAFRRKIEKQGLPGYYQGAIAPIDPQVLQRLAFYFEQSKLPSSYFETRNDLVGKSYSSQFSAYLSCGALDVRYLYNAIKDYEERHGSNKSTYWLVFELLWREFFYWHYQKVGSQFFSANGIKGEEDFSHYSQFSFNDLRRLSDSSFWHAALNELEETGLQSNRVRQNFASYWIHDLGLHWRCGAQFFQEHLVDYDVYSNWGNWMYLAGVGVDPRGSRRFDVAGQLKRYDPKGEYFAKWL